MTASIASEIHARSIRPILFAPREQVTEFETELLRFITTSNAELVKAIEKDRAISDEMEKKLRAAIEEFRKSSPLVPKKEAAKPAEPQPEPAEPQPKAARGGPLQKAKAAVERETRKEQ